jgi:FAD/FMN-containing dehydrogenase
MPPLDGEWLVDEASRQSVAVDWGFQIHRTPGAVLRPKSVGDVARMVAYANQRGLKIAMRGRGHSVYGQAQVENGIVIDSSTLSTVLLHDGDILDAEPGALWGDVAKAAATQGRTPPVMVDAMMLTVGGTLSVGGTGETSYRFGAQVDNVLELDVVTDWVLDTEPAWPQFVRELENFLPALPANPSGAEPEILEGLTVRELEVLELIAQGLNNETIGSLLGISEKTARNHVSIVFSKLGVNSRAQAIVWAREAGFGRKLAGS